jgi:hypothetical protein
LLNCRALITGALVAAERDPASSGGALSYLPRPSADGATLGLTLRPTSSYTGAASDCSPTAGGPAAETPGSVLSTPHSGHGSACGSHSPMMSAGAHAGGLASTSSPGSPALEAALFQREAAAARLAALKANPLASSAPGALSRFGFAHRISNSGAPSPSAGSPACAGLDTLASSAAASPLASTAPELTPCSVLQGQGSTPCSTPGSARAAISLASRRSHQGERTSPAGNLMHRFKKSGLGPSSDDSPRHQVALSMAMEGHEGVTPTGE